MSKPRRVKVKLTRTVTEIALVLLDSEGNVEELEEVLEEVDCDDIQVVTVISVISRR